MFVMTLHREKQNTCKCHLSECHLDEISDTTHEQTKTHICAICVPYVHIYVPYVHIYVPYVCHMYTYMCHMYTYMCHMSSPTEHWYIHALAVCADTTHEQTKMLLTLTKKLWHTTWKNPKLPWHLCYTRRVKSCMDRHSPAKRHFFEEKNETSGEAAAEKKRSLAGRQQTGRCGRRWCRVIVAWNNSWRDILIPAKSLLFCSVLHCEYFCVAVCCSVKSMFCCSTSLSRTYSLVTADDDSVQLCKALLAWLRSRTYSLVTTGKVDVDGF